ncbi:Mu transposase C-terminal domain-containing protein [Dankookia sp. GCM10030260]|uniref:Mu transposase C-terminal domain-containing protein n=1 Tax=Dankookia sp. GCM10030260 TaxID=3273390 RepID=UPI0036116191
MLLRAAAELDLGVRQIQRLLRAWRAEPVATTLLFVRPGVARGTHRLPAAVDGVMERAIDGFYKTRERPRLTALLRQVRHDCRAGGLPPPSMKALRARVSARQLRDLVRAREGGAVARDRLAPATGHLQAEGPLGLVQVDHTLVDVHVVDDTLRQPIGRPWLTLVLDVHTRCVLGLLLALDPPSSTAVALALTHAVLPKEAWLEARALTLAWPMRGLPGTVHLDNAPEFHARALSLGCEQHGIALDYRPPATPRYGGHIERLTGTLMDRLHALPGTAFSSTAERGDYPAEARAVLTLRELERYIALEVVGPYHNDVHAGLGQPPAAAWAAALAAGWQPRAPTEPGRFAVDFLPFAERAVGREGLRLFGIHYFDGALAALIGTRTRLRVRYDPRDLSAIFAEMPQGGPLRVPYADLARPPISLWEHRAATRRLRAEGRRMVDEDAIFAAVAEQRRTVAEACAASKAARRSAARTAEARRMPVVPAVAGSAGPARSHEAPAEPEEARVPMPTDEDIAASEFLT